jgi:hypothetical protein
MTEVPRKRRNPLRGREALPGAFMGLAFSGIVAALLALNTSDVAVLGVGIALLGTLIVLIYELIRRFDQRGEAEDHRSALLAALDGQRTQWLLLELREIAACAKNAIDDDRNSVLFEGLIRDRIEETRLFMQDLERGRVRVPAGDVTQMSTKMTNQIDNVTEIIRATTIPKLDNEWWLSTAGRDYLDRNRRAIETGVKTERIVLWDEDDDFETLAKVIKQQLAAEVEVLFAKRSEIGSGTLKTGIASATLKTSIAIYDDSTYNEVVFNFEGEEIYVEYYLEPSDAKKAIARFKQLHGLATKAVPPKLKPFMEG